MPTLLEAADRHAAVGCSMAAIPQPRPFSPMRSRPLDRLSIYRNTSRNTLTNALRLNYPAVHRLVGEDFFAAAADTFHHDASRRAPPGSMFMATAFRNFWSASSRPRRCSTFLMSRGSSAPLAALLHAVDAEPLELSTLANVDGVHARSQSCFTPHPSVGLISSDYPVDAIWRAVLARDDAAMAAIDLAAGAVRLIDRAPRQ